MNDENIDFDIAEELFEVHDLSIEFENMLAEFGNVEEFKSISMESATTDAQLSMLLKFESVEDSLWEKIKEKLKKFLQWLKKLFESLWIRVKTFFMDTDGKWFENNKYALKRTIEKTIENLDLKINIRNYNFSINVIQSYAKDIELVNTSVDKLYDLGSRLVEEMLHSKTPETHKFWGSGFKNVKSKLMNDIIDTRNNLCASMGLSTDVSSISPEAVKSAIMKKYYSQKYIDKSEPKSEIEVKRLVSSYDEAELICSRKGTEEIKNLCDKIKRGSSVMEMYLKDLDSFIRQSEYSSSDDNHHSSEMKSFINTIKSSVVLILQSVSKLASALGTNYWVLYMNIRSDTLKVCKKVFSANQDTK